MKKRFTVEMAGRRYRVATGKSSQTVNRYSLDCETYDEVLRLNAPSSFLTDGEFKALQKTMGSPEEFRQELEGRGAVHETRGPGTLITSDLSWLQRDQIRDEIRTVLDALVVRFTKSPFFHRVEHSLHCELWSMLIERPVFAGSLSLGNVETRIVHKEWPEVTVRSDTTNRKTRGQYDLAILGPGCELTKRDFHEGRIEPAVAFELGLNYGLKHLTNDHDKLQILTSQGARTYGSETLSPLGFLVHFATTFGGNQNEVIEAIEGGTFEPGSVDYVVVIERPKGDFVILKSWESRKTQYQPPTE